jgi:hypothetical protein
MVTRPQASEPAVAAIAPTVATEPLCTAKTLAEQSGAATEQPSDQATEPPRTAKTLANQSGAATAQPSNRPIELMNELTEPPSQAIKLEEIKNQIFALVIQRRDEAPCKADVELLARAFADELADSIFAMASAGKGDVTELIDSTVTSCFRATAIWLTVAESARVTETASPTGLEPIAKEDMSDRPAEEEAYVIDISARDKASSQFVPLVLVQLAVVSSLVGAQVATVLQVGAPEAPPTRCVDVAPYAMAQMTGGMDTPHATATPIDVTAHGRPPGARTKKKKKPWPSFLPDYEDLDEDVWNAADQGICRSGVLMMHAGPTIADGGADTDPDLVRIVTVMDESDLPSADLVMLMPTGVSYDEYIEYVMLLDTYQISELINGGGDAVHGSAMFCGDEPFAVSIILIGSCIDDMTVDDVFNLMPDDTTPANFARACVLMGESMRSSLLARLG